MAEGAQLLDLLLPRWVLLCLCQRADPPQVEVLGLCHSHVGHFQLGAALAAPCRPLVGSVHLKQWEGVRAPMWSEPASAVRLESKPDVQHHEGSPCAVKSTAVIPPCASQPRSQSSHRQIQSKPNAPQHEGCQ